MALRLVTYVFFFRSPKDRKDPPMEGWKNLYSKGRVLKIASFEGPMILRVVEFGLATPNAAWRVYALQKISGAEKFRQRTLARPSVNTGKDFDIRVGGKVDPMGYKHLEPICPLFWSKTRSFPIKTRVIWVPGINHFIIAGF